MHKEKSKYQNKTIHVDSKSRYLSQIKYEIICCHLVADIQSILNFRGLLDELDEDLDLDF